MDKTDVTPLQLVFSFVGTLEVTALRDGVGTLDDSALSEGVGTPDFIALSGGVDAT